MQEFKVIDFKGERYYEDVNGNRFVSVTTPLGILSVPYLAVWEARIGKVAAGRISKKAAGYGSTIHAAMEKLCRGEEYETKSPKVKEQLISAREWAEKKIKKVVLTEEVVWSKKYMVAGRFDFLGEVEGLDGLTVVDWKSGKIKKEHFLQLAVYRQLIAESKGIPLEDIKHRLVVQIRDNKVVEVAPDKNNPMEDTNMETDFEVYKALLQVFHYFRG